MARGGGATKQLDTTNAVAADQGAKANAIEGKVLPAYSTLADTGYFSPDEAAAATTGEMGAATAPFDTAKFEAANRAGATRNPADLTAQQDQLAIEEGQASGTAADTLQRQKMAGQIAGLQGEAGQGAQNLSAEEAMYGLGPGTLNAQANLENSSYDMFNSVITPIIQSAGQATGAAVACWVARAVYGDDDPRWKKVRDILFKRATQATRWRMALAAYLAFGPYVAELVKRSPMVKGFFRRRMDIVIANG